jgi:hypothetical protein
VAFEAPEPDMANAGAPEPATTEPIVAEVLPEAEIARDPAAAAVAVEAPEPDMANARAPEPATTEPIVAEVLPEAEIARDPAAAAVAVEASEPDIANARALDEPVASEPMPAESTPAAPIAYAATDVANDAAPEPAVKPILVGSGEEPAERKRGWWRR